MSDSVSTAGVSPEGKGTGASQREDGPGLSPIKAILADIQAYDREYRKWYDRAKGILERYRDTRTEPVNQVTVLRKYNILWSNVEVLKPTLYARLPEVAVARRFKDADPVGRLACEIAERMGNYVIQTSGFDDVMKSSCADLLLPGRACSWIGYESQGDDVETGEVVKDEEGNEVKNDDGTPKMETAYEKTHESVVPKYVDYRDIFHSPVRKWDEVKVFGRWVYLTEQELIDRFGEDKAKEIPLDRKQKDEKDSVDFVTPQAKIFEAYYKPTKKVYWGHLSSKEALDEADPPVEFENFWPAPKPLWATMTNDTLIPIPDFIFYQDQANELDIITNRIARLTDAMKAVGAYDKSTPELARILGNNTPDNTLIAVDSWAAFAEKGGLAGAIQLVPVEVIAGIITALYAAREQTIQIIYDVTGISDIIRGSTNPNETAEAQSLKGQFASIRIKDKQAEVARFARDNARLIIECGIRMFEPETIAEMVMAENFCPMTPQEQQMRQLIQTPQGKMLQQAGHIPAKLPPPASFMAALKLMQDDKLRSFHIDIETDSTIALNENEDKQQSTEFLGALGGFLNEMGTVAATLPAVMPVMGEALLYMVRRYRAGRSLEASIEKAVAQMAQPQPPKPNPEMLKIQAQTQGKQAEVQANAKIDAADVQRMGTRDKMEQTRLAAKDATDSKLDAAKIISHVAPIAGARMASAAVAPPPVPRAVQPMPLQQPGPQGVMQ